MGSGLLEFDMGEESELVMPVIDGDHLRLDEIDVQAELESLAQMELELGL
jgi:hypothetical protein